MRYAILGDIHFGVKGNDPTFLKHQLDYLESVIQYVKKNNIDGIIQLGDTFHNRFTTNNFLMTEITHKFFDRLNQEQIESYFIVGNHDQVHKDDNTHSPLYSFRSKYIHVITKPKIIDNKIGLIPYSFEKLPKVKYLCGHFDIQGFKMNNSKLSEEGYKPSDFKDYIVYSGHYHTPSNSGNINYLGTPFQLDFNNFGDNLGFLVLDTETGETFFNENTISPEHVTITYIEDEDGLKLLYNNGKLEDVVISEDEIDNVINKRHDYVKLIIKSCIKRTNLDRVKQKIDNLIKEENKDIFKAINLNDVDIELSSIPETFSNYLDFLQEDLKVPKRVNIADVKVIFNDYIKNYEEMMNE